MTGTTADADTAVTWAACHCCGRSFPAASMVTFDQHPGDHLCIPCLRWLCEQARRVIRIPLQPRIRGWAARLLPRSTSQASGQPTA